MPAAVPNTFVPGQLVQSSQVNANFSALVSYINGLNIPTTPVALVNGGTGGTTPKTALTGLGLAVGTVIPCACSITGTAINLVGGGGSPAVSSYQLGVTYAFVVPATTTGPFTIVDNTTTGSGLVALPLYDSPGVSTQTAALTANQLCLASYTPAISGGAFVLLNTPPQQLTGVRFAQFTAAGSWTCPTGVTTAYATMAGGGGGGGSAAGFSGGGGGGGAAALKRSPFATVPGAQYIINVGAGGAGATGVLNTPSPGLAGGTSSIITTSSTTVFSCPGGGGGGAGGITTGFSLGGAAGGSGGLPGGQGNYFSTGPSLQSGCGGGCLLGGGASIQTSGGGAVMPGIQPGEYGGGGSGGAGNSASGGSGASGIVTIEW